MLLNLQHEYGYITTEIMKDFRMITGKQGFTVVHLKISRTHNCWLPRVGKLDPGLSI
jgi:hypothetical protein